MPAAPLPRCESERLSTLRSLDVLDTRPEAFSEAVSTAAATIANTPIAAISLVDAGRQWFKGRCGLEVSETPRQVSFCAHAILDDEPLVVPDALLDSRFADNALVTGPAHVRFYAGFPLIVDGQAVGALCVLDDHARALSPTQIAALVALAEGTSAWLAGYRTRARE